MEIERSKTNNTGSTSKGCSTCAYIGIASILVINLIVALCYGLLDRKVHSSIDAPSRVCSDDKKNDKILEEFTRSDAQYVKTWMYNITNPHGYLAGSSAHLDETGVYGFNLIINRGDLEFKDEGKIAAYNYYFEISYDEGSSCSNCGQSDDIVVFNHGYNGLMISAYNELSLMLTLACSATQIGLMSDNTIPLCTAAQQGTAAMCRCCAPSPPAGTGVLCAAIGNKGSKQGGMLSLMSKYDSGIQIGSAVVATYPFVSGQYTSLLTHKTPHQVARGLPSVLLGHFATRENVLSSNTEYLNWNIETTKDMVDVCFKLDYCPDYADIAKISSNETFLSTIQDVSCEGLVPNYKVLQSEYGYSEEDAKALRYLEGAQCNVVSPSIIIAALVERSKNGGGSLTCFDDNADDDYTYTMPCCPSAFTYSYNGIAYTGAYTGCLRYFPGILAERPSFSNDEAVKYAPTSLYAETYTGCADTDGLKFSQHIFKNHSTVNTWFTPDTTPTLDASHWADTTVIRDIVKETYLIPGELMNQSYGGKIITIREGKGVTGKFLDWQLTSNGRPEKDEYDVFVPARREQITTKYVGDTRNHGVELNIFQGVTNFNDTQAYAEEVGKNGEQPYPNLRNMVYMTNGVPIISSLPNFYGVNEDIYSQTDNSARQSTSNSGISIFQTKDGYGIDAVTLLNKTLMSKETVEMYAERFQSIMQVEPAMGLTISASIVNMVSTFSTNCDPTYDLKCRMLASVDPKMCYSAVIPGRYMPCNSANVFTPYVQGAKVQPIFWFSLEIDTKKQIKPLRDAMDVRQGFSVLILIIPILSVIAFIAIAKVEWYSDDSETTYDKAAQNSNI